MMEELYKYVPCTKMSSKGSDAKNIINFGGDQMTMKMDRGSQKKRSFSKSPSAQLQRLHLVVEDWHAKVIPLQGSDTIVIISISIYNY